MLLIYDVTSATDAKNYYAACLSPGGKADRQGYYSEGQETPGVYGGKLGEELGLAGRPVDQATFERLCDNRHPFENRTLTPRTNDFRRVCKDMTFSGPKSFSLIEAFADEGERRHLRRIFDEAVAETVAGDMEPDMQCRVRAGGADHDITTGNVLTAGFDHATSRPEDDAAIPDPHWHKHLLFWNATRRADGRIMAGQFGDIVRDKGYYEAAFYSRLAEKLQGLGYGIDRRGGKEWEIAGIPQSMIDTFSKRTAQIDAAAERLGIVDASEKAKLGAKIRAKKQKELTLPELRKAWDAQLSDEERDALARVYAREIAPGEGVTASEAVRYAVQHCFEREAVISERELVRVALLHGLGDVSVGQVRAELPAQGVMLAERDGRLMATTKEAFGMERFVINHAKEGRGGVEAVGVPAGLERGILDDEQWNAVRSLLSSCDRVQLVDSAAGVGKSTMLSVFDQGMKRAGKQVTYLATTTPAVGVLQQDGFAAETVAKFLLSEKMQDAARGGTVVVDEASMMGLRDAYRLFRIAKEKQVKLVLLGDSRQHSSVAAGAVMRTLQQYGGVTPLRITEIKRQKNRHHRDAVKLLFEGKTLEGFDILDKKLGWVHEVKDADARYQAIAAAYVQARTSKARGGGGMGWDDILLVSPTHAEGQRVTDAIRHELREAGLIGTKDHGLTRWVSADLTEAERGDARNYRPGTVDMVQFFQNVKGHASGSRVEVTEKNRAALPLGEAAKFQAYRKEAVHFTEGDVIRFTANGTALDGHRIRNGSAYKIAGFTAKGIRLDNGWVVSQGFGHFKHGIETSYGSQSKTVKLAIVGQSSQSFGASSMEQAYVTASRARLKTLTFTDDKAGLRAAIQRSSLKLAAHDLFPAPATPPVQATWRKRLARWSHGALLARNRDDAAARRRQPTTPPRLPPSPQADRLRTGDQERSGGYGR